MESAPIMLGRQIAKFFTEHPYLSVGINAVAGFFVGIFVKEPIQRWWKDRGRLKQTRKALYLALAEIFTDVELFFKGLDRVLSHNNPAIEEEEVTRLIDIFYEQIMARDYRRELTALRAARISLAGEVEGFERVMHYSAQLPSSKDPVNRKFDGVLEFCNKFSMAMLTEAFDLQILAPIIVERRKTEVLRRLTILETELRQKVTETQDKLSKIDTEFDKIRAANQQVLQETDPDRIKIDLDQTRRLIARTREVLARCRATHASSATSDAA